MLTTVRAQCDPSKTDILWVEADNEAQEGQTRSHVSRSLLAYLLLSNKLIIHPAYVWQSDITRSIVLGDVGKVLTPNSASLFLGLETDSVRAYMDARIQKTSTMRESPHGGRSEYEEYMRHGEFLLNKEQTDLDERFTSHGAIVKSISSRDHELRKLLRFDLINEGRLSERLSGILLRDPSVPDRVTFSGLSQLSDWTQNERVLVSGDTLVAEVMKIASYGPRTLQAVDRRAHILHWACHITESTRVPFIHRATDSNTLDPFDSELFWAAMRSMLGDSLCTKWLTLSEADALRVAIDLRNTGTWSEFRNVYVSIVLAIDQLSLPLEERTVVEAIQVALPSRQRILLRRLFSLPLISLICGSLRAAVGDIAGGVLQTGGGAVSLANNLLRELEKFNVALRDDLALHVRSAIRNVMPDESILPIKIHANDVGQWRSKS